jgi:hypothetical protein
MTSHGAWLAHPGTRSPRVALLVWPLIIVSLHWHAHCRSLLATNLASKFADRGAVSSENIGKSDQTDKGQGPSSASKHCA